MCVLALIYSIISPSQSPTPAESSTTASSLKSSGSRTVAEPAAKAEPAFTKPQKKVQQESAADDSAGSSLAVEKIRRQTAERIDMNPGARECDLTDPTVCLS